MSDKIYMLLIVLVVLATKHLIFDFFLQTLWQIRNKGHYGHVGGLLHAAGHAAGTCLAFLVITPPILVAIGIVVAEFVLHYHIDWFKEQIGHRMKLNPEQSGYWRAVGTDQWLHQMTYIGIVLVLATL